MPVSHRHSRQFLFIAILLLGINLRPILAVVGPLLEQIQQATGLDDSQAGLLTTLPILAMVICALSLGYAHWVVGECCAWRYRHCADSGIGTVVYQALLSPAQQSVDGTLYYGDYGWGSRCCGDGLTVVGYRWLVWRVGMLGDRGIYRSAGLVQSAVVA